MQKTEAYHEAAIQYNEGLAESAEALAPTLEHEEVKKWCIAVGKQHRFHAKRHRSALNKLLIKQEAPPVEALADGLDVPDPEDVDSVVETLSVDKDATEQNSKTSLRDEASRTFDDGCVGSHMPMEESCQYYPKGNNNA